LKNLQYVTKCLPIAPLCIETPLGYNPTSHGRGTPDVHVFHLVKNEQNEEELSLYFIVCQKPRIFVFALGVLTKIYLFPDDF
jgi:hypothetical protein